MAGMSQDDIQDFVDRMERQGVPFLVMVGDVGSDRTGINTNVKEWGITGVNNFNLAYTEAMAKTMEEIEKEHEG